MAYFDYNATTPLHPEVALRLAEALKDAAKRPANASSVHQDGRNARQRLEEARQTIARILGCEASEVCFTASGSEANALGLAGAFRARPDVAKKTVVLSSIEHPAVLMAAQQIEKEGARLVFLSPDNTGRVSEEALDAQLTDDVALCALMWANNETGVLQPARQAGLLCQKRGILFHCDAVQAVGKVDVNLREVNADLLALTAHKFGGPSGVGALVVRKGVNLQSLVPGHQENGRRGGTHNLLYVEAMAQALALAHESLLKNVAHIQTLRDFLEEEVLRRISGVRVNGAAHARVPNTSNLWFEGADAEALLIALDLSGARVSMGAACASGSLTPSHVLTAMGLSAKEAKECLRISMGPSNTREEVELLVKLLEENVPHARQAT